VDRDAELVGSPGEELADIVAGAEPEAAVVEAGGEALGDEQAGAAVAGGDSGGLVEERAGVEDLEDFGVGMSETVPAGWAELVEEPGELTAPRAVEGLEEPPVATGGQDEVIIG